jgi:hypothetical protein
MGQVRFYLELGMESLHTLQSALIKDAKSFIKNLANTLNALATKPPSILLMAQKWSQALRGMGLTRSGRFQRWKLRSMAHMWWKSNPGHA